MCSNIATALLGKLIANNYKIPKVIAGTSCVGATSLVSLKIYNERSNEKELKHKRQFDLLMGSTEEKQSPHQSFSQMMRGFSNNFKNTSSSYSLFIEATCTLLHNSCMDLS